MKSYIKHKVGTRNSTKKNEFLVEVEVMGKEWMFGRELAVVRPVSGEGNIRINMDSVIVKKH